MTASDLLIAVASTNPVKLAAAHNGFSRAFPQSTLTVRGYSLTTTISNQPMSDDETYHGAMMRVETLCQEAPQAAFWVGIEGGVEKNSSGLYDSFAWIVLRQGRRQFSSRTGTFPLPPAVGSLLEKGLELGDADDQVFGSTLSKQQTGAIGLLTHDQITRTDLLAQSVFLALIPFQSPALYHTL